jgi:hypothetical protein
VDFPEPLRALECDIGSEFVGTSTRVPVFLRRLEERDRPWLVDLCKRRYPPYYDAVTADHWLRHVVLTNPIQYYATRTANAFQITNLTTTAWAPTIFKADIVFICCDHDKMWEAIPLLRDSIQWAKDRYAVAWRFETETDYDLAPIMKRLGVGTRTPRYILDLRANLNGGNGPTSP